MLVEAATITPGYVTARMQALIKEFGEQDAYWYENIRLGVLKGISVTILPQHEQDKFWHILKKRAKDIGDEIYAPNRKGWKEKEETYDNEPTEDIDMGTTNETGYSRGCMTYGNSSSIKRGASLRQSPLTPLTPL